MLSCLKIDVDKCITTYNDLTSAVFDKKPSCFLVNIKGQIKPRFNLAKPESIIQEAVAKSSISKTKLLNNRTKHKCKT